jgi:hypothetical protein
VNVAERGADAADEEDFWATAHAEMGSATAKTHLERESERFANSLGDEFEPEDWRDIL